MLPVSPVTPQMVNKVREKDYKSEEILRKQVEIDGLDWEQLRKSYLAGPWLSVTDFLKDKSIESPVGEESVIRFPQTVGWRREKESLLVIEVAKKKAMAEVEKKKSMVFRIKNRQARIVGKMIELGMEGLKLYKPNNMEETRKLLSTALTQQRAVMSMGQEGGAGSKYTQVNFNLPKTRFDELLDGQSTEGLLELIAAVRRERARRTGEGDVVEVQAEDK